MSLSAEELQSLKRFFADEPIVRLAYLFGSEATGRTMAESDVDVAVYLQDPRQEDRIWRRLTTLLGREVDLIRLDEAPATLVSAVLKRGVPLAMKDRDLHGRLYLGQTLEAEDFAEFASSYRAIAARSASLTPE